MINFAESENMGPERPGDMCPSYDINNYPCCENGIRQNVCEKVAILHGAVRPSTLLAVYIGSVPLSQQ